MSQNDQGLVDLLEIYHARRLRDDILTNLRRLRVDNPQNPFQDHARKRETRGYYETMLLAAAELLRGLGDDLPPA